MTFSRSLRVNFPEKDTLLVFQTFSMCITSKKLFCDWANGIRVVDVYDLTTLSIM